MEYIPESTQKHIDDLVKTINKLNKEINKLTSENKDLKEQLHIYVVNGILCENCHPNEIDITRCPNCNSTDHRMHKPYKCHDCGTVW